MRGTRLRYHQRWEPNCPNHDSVSCRCDLIFEFPVELGIQSICVPKVVDGVWLTPKEQHFRVFRELVSKYDIDAGHIVPILDKEVSGSNARLFAFEFWSTECNKLVQAPFTYRNIPMEREVKDMPNLRPILLELDKYYFKQIGVDYRVWERQIVPSLRQMIMSQYSFMSIYYDKRKGLRGIANTMSNLSDEKITSLFAEFSRDCIGRAGFSVISKLVPQALRMVDMLLDRKSKYGTVPFRYDPSMLAGFVTKLASSAGIRPGVNKPVQINGQTVKETHQGKKLDQFVYYALQFDEFVHYVKQNGVKDYDKNDLFEFYCVMRLKDEMKFAWPMTHDQCVSLLRKCREFFIPNMMQQFLSKLLMTPRQLIERGDVIKIGHKWNYGGAQRTAEYLHAFSENMCWNTGDFIKLDKSIRDWVLSLYIATGKKYFYCHTDDMKKLMDDLFIILSEHINVKLVNHIRGAWTLMLAMMYSGGFETSHGDSWCVLFAFCLYLSYVIANFPDRAARIRVCFEKGLIRIIVYGDDHVWCCPVRLSDILNERGFADFVKQFLGMEIRDAECLKNFFSTVFPNGELRTKGVVFLKRYFICERLVKKPGYPCVYPFKPTHQTAMKLFCNQTNDEYVYPLKAIGQAMDTLGTNPVAYEICRRFYNYYLKVLPGSPQEIVAQAFRSMNADQVLGYLKKCGITRDELENGFPSREFLLSKHFIDDEKNTNVVNMDPINIYTADDFY